MGLICLSVFAKGTSLISASRSKYLMWHMRRQLAFDVWPLALAVLTISMLERGKLLDPQKCVICYNLSLSVLLRKNG